MSCCDPAVWPRSHGIPCRNRTSRPRLPQSWGGPRTVWRRNWLGEEWRRLLREFPGPRREPDRHGSPRGIGGGAGVITMGRSATSGERHAAVSAVVIGPCDRAGAGIRRGRANVRRRWTATRMEWSRRPSPHPGKCPPPARRLSIRTQGHHPILGAPHHRGRLLECRRRDPADGCRVPTKCGPERLAIEAIAQISTPAPPGRHSRLGRRGPPLRARRRGLANAGSRDATRPRQDSAARSIPLRRPRLLEPTDAHEASHPVPVSGGRRWGGESIDGLSSAPRARDP